MKFTAYIRKYREIHQSGFAQTTIQHYKQLEKLWKKFPEPESRQTIDQFIEYLWKKKKYLNETIKSYIRYTNTVNLYFSLNLPIHTKQIYKKLKNERSDMPFLSVEEIKWLAGHKLTRSQDQKARDLYVWCCYTGMRHEDLSVSPDISYKMRSDGTSYTTVRYVMKKTKKSVEVPLNEFCKCLIDTHDGLPLLSNQKCNESLHRILRESGKFNDLQKKIRYSGPNRIEEDLARWEMLTFHSSRHSFTNYLYKKGIPEHIIEKLVGDTLYTIKKHYLHGDEVVLDSLLDAV